MAAKRRDVAAARDLLARPFAGPHAESVRRRMAPPKGLGGLLAWYLEAFRAEMPERIHGAGVWRDWTRLDDDRKAVGGSLLGSPRLADPFRAFLEDSPFAVEAGELDGHQSRDGDVHYRTPVRAAIARLAGSHRCTALERKAPAHECPDGYSFARLAYRIALRDGDWQSAAAEFGPFFARAITEQALYRLWRAFDVYPPVRIDDREREVAIA